MKKALFVITGVMAAGKSTIAELLSRNLKKCVHLHGDVFRKMIVTGREEMCENPSEEALRQLDMRYNIAANTAKEYFDNGFTVVVQDNYLGEKLTYFTSLLKGYPVYVIVLCPDIKTIEHREAHRGKRGYTGFTVESLYNSFIETTPKIGLWLDTSNMSPEETVEEILERAENEAQIFNLGGV